MDFDAELIRALQDDGRASIQTLAARLGQPRAAVSARIRSLTSDGTVRVVGAVDPSFLGQHVLAHVSITTGGSVREVAAELQTMPESVLVSAVGGAQDLITEVRVASMSELHDVLGRIREFQHVRTINTLVYAEVVKGFFVSNYRGDITIDDIDTELIGLLQIDGRASYRALAEAVRLSPSAVTSRVQNLIGGGVITISAVEARGLNRRQLSMGVGLNLVSADDETVLDALREMRSVDFVARTLGRYDVVATVVEPSSGGLFESVERIRSLAGVVQVQTWLHMAVMKEDYARTLRPLAT